MAHALVIGAGVAGPVTAMALQRAGLDATVYEARPAAEGDIGSYLTVATNGLDALRAIGAHEAVLAAGFPTRETVMWSGNGRCLGTVPIGTRRADGLASHTVKRARLHRALHDEAVRRGIRIERGRRLVSAESMERGVAVRFDDGTGAEGDLLIGCDGIHSPTRRIIDPGAPAPRYVGLLNFGGYTAGTAVAAPGAWHMIFGKRAFLGYTTDAAGGTVWFANVPRAATSRAEREATAAEEWKRQLIDIFAGDAGPATDIIAAGVLELAADNTHDLPFVPRWHRGRMIVVGDAAHAPSPTSGQGASLAIEDAVVLAKCLRDVAEVPRAFATFERQRRRRVERVVAQGARGSSSKAAGPLGRVIRDLMLPFVFRHLVTERSMAWMYEHHVDWQLPAEAEAAS